ncbi:erythromycin esterase [Microbulbifer flavimaris]|uniref:Erythromycin esterase n=1 Tax=Microbulbifer flavimaris TaxID=1781068 RepID=A0ABX4I239_9GAMM|nr:MULTISPECIES: erythromycin esterase family protein [Microbulbifer]KUJ84403.1 erythromycin esterase [Microbulbifer sp. ZGT114]PCO06487.1 erythromycin esterase [Microbulbifer flavimaris]
MSDSSPSINVICDTAQRLTGSATDYRPLLRLASGREMILLGEASHGTHEFYQRRADITQALIEDQGLDAVIIEGDWPDVARINHYVRGHDRDSSAREALADFERFPLWMWRNTEMAAFVQWLREWNSRQERDRQTGIYGMDLYSMYRSAEAVVQYLETVDPEAAGRARERYACMNHHRDPQRYGYRAAMGISESCQQAAVEQLLEMMERRNQWLLRDGPLAEDEEFYAERNARVVHHAEAYYRGMFFSDVNTWNLRDRHMVNTVMDLRQHLSRQRDRPARIALWAHNSHLGDARATDAARQDEVNVGQLVREKLGEQALLIGFTTYTGHVTAAREWDEPAEHRWVRPALEGSVETLFHETGLGDFYLDLHRVADCALHRPLLERAIGVIYRPETEGQSHYFRATVAEQFDALFHLEETRALQPLDITEHWEAREPPETWPYGT